MSYQISVFLCDLMRLAIEVEASRVGAKLVKTYSDDLSLIQFSTSSGTDEQQGRLWTQTKDLTSYEVLCRAVKKGAYFDRGSHLWVKRASRVAFEAYRDRKAQLLAELVAKNRKYAIEVLGGRTSSD